MPSPTPPVPSILVVDDDADVRQIASRILGTWGFRVREAETAEEAFAALLSEPDRPQLILIDLVLPASDGVTLAQQIREEWPHQRVLYMSGYPAEVLRASGSDAPVMEKPFTPGQLLQHVEAALAWTPTRPIGAVGEATS